jgi:dihydroxy-acid dehydratase
LGKEDGRLGFVVSHPCRKEPVKDGAPATEAKGAAAWKPATRNRKVSQALQAYAAMTTSASRGAVRDVSRIQK